MDLEYLKKYAESFLRKNYNLSLEIPLLINNRLRSTLGSFNRNYKGDKACEIELSGQLVKYATKDVILDTLKHELIHYALFVLNKPFHDGDEYFENELKRLEVSGTETCYVGIHTVYNCPKCARKYETELKSVWKTPNVYNTVCCREPINMAV